MARLGYLGYPAATTWLPLGYPLVTPWLPQSYPSLYVGNKAKTAPTPAPKPGAEGVEDLETFLDLEGVWVLAEIGCHFEADLLGFNESLLEGIQVLLGLTQKGGHLLKEGRGGRRPLQLVAQTVHTSIQLRQVVLQAGHAVPAHVVSSHYTGYGVVT